MEPRTPKTFFAHSLPDRPTDDWQDLEQHLKGVATLAAERGRAFGAEDWAYLAGLWHDVGKYRPAFQQYLRGEAPSSDHSTVGAMLAAKRGERQAFALSLSIAGHHGGLPNLRNPGDGRTAWTERERTRQSLLSEAERTIPRWLKDHPLPPLPERFTALFDGTLQPRAEGTKPLLRSFEMWIRFVFSALVDADFLDTEAFYVQAEGRGQPERGAYEPIPALGGRLDEAIDELTTRADATRVNQQRAAILTACRERAKEPLGIFSLTVPTGGGKTLSGMSFALRHAAKHGLRRVIVAIPFTTILDQNARAYRQALGEDQVIEHHSAVEPAEEHDEDAQKAERRRLLACENWDAPVVLTTNVQFFESLFASRPSRCRKLHNIAQSVIILDEIQALPPELLLACLEGLRELVDHYGCSVVLSTATPPALRHRPALPHGLEGVREIVPDPTGLSLGLRRCRIEWPDPAAPPITWEALADEVAELDQVLVVTHLRRDAVELASLLPQDGTYHLSAAMCGAHRLTVLDQARKALQNGEACRLVSTQLIEAGVDIDFPVVYRALGGLDSIIQAAGRANREGRRDVGRVVVFRAPTQPPPGTPRKGLKITEKILQQHGEGFDPFDPASCEQFFRDLYMVEDLDPRQILLHRGQLDFQTVDQQFQMIPEFMQAVAIPFDETARQRLNAFEYGLPSRKAFRALAPFLVQVPPRIFRRLENAGALRNLHDTLPVLSEPFFRSQYHRDFGLQPQNNPQPDPSSLVG
ncbi:MAG: CRISPR-associated endonuclease Cas3'' [Acidobacteriota bacterium]